MMELRRINGARFLRASVLEIGGFTHAFGTRDLGRASSQARAAIKAAFPGLERVVMVKQVHETGALFIDRREDAPKGRVEADIIVVAAAGVAATVRTADCVPVLIADPRRRVAAAIHAGWRGTAQLGPARAVELLVGRHGSSPSDLLAAIGPCVGPCHYQVDAPVIEAIEAALGKQAAAVLSPDPDDPAAARLDLSRANRLILEAAGVPPSNIEEARICSYCRDDLFFSYRREGKGVPSLHHFIAIVGD